MYWQKMEKGQEKASQQNYCLYSVPKILFDCFCRMLRLMQSQHRQNYILLFPKSPILKQLIGHEEWGVLHIPVAITITAFPNELIFLFPNFRTKASEEPEQVTSTTHIFRALPLNRKVSETGSKLRFAMILILVTFMFILI